MIFGSMYNTKAVSKEAAFVFKSQIGVSPNLQRVDRERNL